MIFASRVVFESLTHDVELVHVFAYRHIHFRVNICVPLQIISVYWILSVLHVVSPAGLLRGFTETQLVQLATSRPPGTGRAKLCSASSMVEAALASHTAKGSGVRCYEPHSGLNCCPSVASPLI